MLLQNSTVLAAEPLTRMGGTLAGERVFLGLRDQTFIAFNSNADILQEESTPGSYRPGNAWFPAIKQGGASARAEISITKSIAAAAGGRNITATANITITPVTAAASLLVDGSATANITITPATVAVLATVLAVADSTITITPGSATATGLIGGSATSTITITPVSAAVTTVIQGTATAPITITPGTATATAIAQATATAPITITPTAAQVIGVIGASADSTITITPVSALLGAIIDAAASANITFTGTASQSSIAWATASAGGPTALSPEGLAQAVWEAIAVDNNDPGTMGEKMNNAASAGDPWGTVVPGAYVAGTAGNLMGKLLTVAKFLGLK